MERIKEVKLSSKGQVTVPKAIRELLCVNNGDSIAFCVDGREIKLTKFKNLQIKIKDERKTAKIQKGDK